MGNCQKKLCLFNKNPQTLKLFQKRNIMYSENERKIVNLIAVLIDVSSCYLYDIKHNYKQRDKQLINRAIKHSDEFVRVCDKVHSDSFSSAYGDVSDEIKENIDKMFTVESTIQKRGMVGIIMFSIENLLDDMSSRMKNNYLNMINSVLKTTLVFSGVKKESHLELSEMLCNNLKKAFEIE